MTKSDLARKLAGAYPHLHQSDAELIISTIFNKIAAALTRRERVELRGFGTFAVKRKAPRIGRNPRTGDSVQVAEKHVPSFRAGRPMHSRLNPQGTIR